MAGLSLGLGLGLQRRGAGAAGGGFIAPDFDISDLAAATDVISLGADTEWDDYGIREIGNVLHDPDDTGEEYKMVYSGHGAAYTGSNVYVGYAYSNDGLSWTKGGKLTLGADRSSEDPYLVKSGSTYYLYVEDKAGGGTHIRCYTSTDFSTWADQGDVLQDGGAATWDDQDVSSPTVWIEGATWYMLYEGRATDQEGAVGLATSSDGLTWAKDAGNPVLVGQNATWSYAGPIAWSEGLVPDDIAKLNDGTYILSFHGLKDGGGTAMFRSGMAKATSLTGPWTDLVGQEIYNHTIDAAIMFHMVDAGLYFLSSNPGAGIRMAQPLATHNPDWSDVALLIMGDGPAGAQNILDMGPVWHQVTVQGNAARTKADKKFGTASIDVQGTDDGLRVANHSSLRPSGAFTIEAHILFDTLTGFRGIAARWLTPSHRSFLLTLNNNTGNLLFSLSADGTNQTNILRPWAPSTGVFYHLAVCVDGSHDLRMFVDGTQLGATEAGVDPSTFFAGNAEYTIGGYIDSGSWIHDLDGRVENFQHTNAAKYTANFTPPSAPPIVG